MSVIKPILVLIASISISGQTITQMHTNSWFTNKDCHILKIQQFKSISSQQIIKEVTITDSASIRDLMNKIETIPADGPMMIKFGPNAEYILLQFIGKDTTQTIAVIQQKFKTPSTGFNEKNESEEKLYMNITKQLKK